MSGFHHHRDVSGSQTTSGSTPTLIRVTKGLVRYYGNQDLHFITCSCFRRQALLRTAKRRDLFLKILEETRRKYRLVVHGYVVMPEHFHLLITEPEVGDPSVVMKVIKQRFARQVNRLRRKRVSAQMALWDFTPDPVWQKRFYDFNVFTERKRIEKLRYMHRNPVKRGLVKQPEQWRWSSFRSYYCGEPGMVRVNFQEWPLDIKARSGRKHLLTIAVRSAHSFATYANEWGTPLQHILYPRLGRECCFQVLRENLRTRHCQSYEHAS